MSSTSVGFWNDFWLRRRWNVFYFIHTEIFASNFALWKSVSDFTSTQSERRNEFLTREKIVSSNHKSRLKRIVFSRSSLVALSGSFDKMLYFRCSRVVRNSNFQVIKSYEIFLRMAEQSRRFVSLDKPIDKFIEDQINKNTLSKTRRDVSLLTEFLNSKSESRRTRKSCQKSLMNISVNLL